MVLVKCFTRAALGSCISIIIRDLEQELGSLGDQTRAVSESGLTARNLDATSGSHKGNRVIPEL